MLRKIKLLYKSIISTSNLNQNIDELLWANVYHDTIKGKEWAHNLSISPCDMAINYSMLYVLTRVLSEYNINSILEFGLGQSSKFINAYIESIGKESKHHIIEHNEEWIEFFSKHISSKSIIKQIKLSRKEDNVSFVQLYENLKDHTDSKYDLYLIDGPIGLPRNSRFDICSLAENFEEKDEFIIIMDDFQRIGEQETIDNLKGILIKKKIKFHSKIFKASKDQMILVTEKYKFATTCLINAS